MDQFVNKRKYINTLSMIYIEAVHRLFDAPTVHIDYTVNQGIYTEIKGIRSFDAASIAKIKREMDTLIQDNSPIKKNIVPKLEAVNIFKQQGFEDKVKALTSASLEQLPLYSIDQRQYYFVGGVFNFTGEVYSYDVLPLNRGLVLVYPNGEGEKELAYVNQEKLFNIYRESEKWARLMKISHGGDLNGFVQAGQLSEIILISEALHEKKIASIADEIDHRKGVRVILIAGPSSSGKTTFAKRLEIQLRVLGKNCMTLGLDDYFINRDQTPLDETGQKNFDALTAVDLPLFGEHLNQLIAGEAVQLPSYNFITGKREYNHGPKHITEDTYVIVEGIHALNEHVTALMPPDCKYKIYISALTPLNVDYHNRIPTTDLRLLRRLVRDHRTRGYSPEETMALWSNVVKGENQNIFPFQENADIMFNSSLIYELTVLKGYAIEVLETVGENSAYYEEANRLLKFLSFFMDCPCEEFIPNTSILKEFIGGSCFKH